MKIFLHRNLIEILCLLSIDVVFFFMPQISKYQLLTCSYLSLLRNCTWKFNLEGLCFSYERNTRSPLHDYGYVSLIKHSEKATGIAGFVEQWGRIIPSLQEENRKSLKLYQYNFIIRIHLHMSQIRGLIGFVHLLGFSSFSTYFVLH